MAHVVGVPKRDPCQKCSLPVFLAERLTIGKKVYHRTCLKCARCQSQLTPGSFYETETDGEYCCETCPDEEKSLNLAKTSTTMGSSDDPSSTQNSSVRREGIGFSKIADRLAFFERDGKRVLQKSLSDEEKSRSLKKFEENQKSSALTNFLNSHLSDTTDFVAQQHEDNSRRSSTTSNSSDDTDEISEEQNSPPKLPTSQPPSMENEPSGKQHQVERQDKQEVPFEKKAADEDIELLEQEQNLSVKKSDGSEIHNDLNNSVNVTKDNSEEETGNYDDDGEQLRINVSPPLADIDPTSTGNYVQEADNTKSNRSSMVRARLHQFEDIVSKQKPSEYRSGSSSSVSSGSSTNSSKKFSSNNNKSSLKKEHLSIDDDASNDHRHDQTHDKQLNDNEVPKKEISNYGKTIQEENKGEKRGEEENLVNKTNASHHNEIKDEDDKDGKDISTRMNTMPVNVNQTSEEIEQTTLLSEEEQHPSELDVDSNATQNTDSKNESSSTNAIALQQSSDITDEITSSAVLSLSEIQEEISSTQDMKSPHKFTDKIQKTEEYPEELNPFKSDDDDEAEAEEKISGSVQLSKKEKRESLNPFESDEEESKNQKLKPPRPPPPKKVSTNPFGSESEDDEEGSHSNSISSGATSKRTPVPTPRNYLSKSQNPTPEPIPRITKQNYGSPLKNSDDFYGSSASLSPGNYGTRGICEPSTREENYRGSTHSLTSSGSGTGTKKKIKKAPAPPPPPLSTKSVKELFPPRERESDSKKSSPNSSNAASPKPRKKRPAPAPPSSITAREASPTQLTDPTPNPTESDSKISQIAKLSDEEKVLLESINSTSVDEFSESDVNQSGIESESGNETTTKRRLIALDASLVEDSINSQDLKPKEEENVVYRRKIVPLAVETPCKDESLSPFTKSEEFHDRQLEKLKDNKESKNRNRQSHVSLSVEDSDPLLNKSVQGKWKRRKGPAPALPIPPRKVLQMLPLEEIRHELEVIEVQQQGLEKQGVMLEKMIRDRCEGQNAEDGNVNSKEVEDLILQLFELVNEKNELFRRQAELMYLRRQHRLEQEQADLEYEIRVLMAQPERNKTDSDKAREESLIARLVEVVQLRNEVIECLEMDRLREAEEDMSIKQRLEMHTAKRDEELSKQTPTKLSKKEKKKQKELKKLGKNKKLDADKDADESEISAEKQKSKKKKKKFLF